MSLRKRALVALTLCLSFVAGATPAEASVSSAKDRPGGALSWYGAFWNNTHVRAYFDHDAYYDVGGPGLYHKRVYRLQWELELACGNTYPSDLGPFFDSGNSDPESYRGLEWDAALPSGLVDQYDTAADGVTGYTLGGVSGLSGDEGFYVDSDLGDGGTKRLGWGLYNPQNLERCDVNGYNNTIIVNLYVSGPADAMPAGQTIVWKAHATHEEPGLCFMGMPICMFGDYDLTLAKSGFQVSGTDVSGVSWSTPGFRAAYVNSSMQKLTRRAAGLQGDWQYHIPNNGNDCRAKFGDPNGFPSFCYDSGYQTGGDYALGDGPPGDSDDTAPRFGDIEGNQKVGFTGDAWNPTNDWTSGYNGKAYATAEVTVKCVTPKSTRSDCRIDFGYAGVANGAVAEENRMFTNYSIPANGHWYSCSVDVEHSGGTQFTNSHPKYRWKLYTDDRWLAFENTLLGNKLEQATNHDAPSPYSPIPAMYNTPTCADVGV